MKLKSYTFCMVFTAALLLVGCKNGRPASPFSDGEERSSAELQDSSSVFFGEDLSETAEDVPMPLAADELFDDFFFNFAGNSRLQRQRILFPLKVTDGDGNIMHLQRNEWKTDPFFMEQDFYTLIFDTPLQAEAAKDTSIVHAVVERINLDADFVSQYVFDRQQGRWFLTTIHHEPLAVNHNASFLEFYQHFSTDSLFQVNSLNPLINFTATDPDDEFNTITGTMVPSQWEAFRPSVIPSGTIYNIVYGNLLPEGSEKLFVIHGIANEMEAQMTFRRRHSGWKLMGFSN